MLRSVRTRAPRSGDRAPACRRQAVLLPLSVVTRPSPALPGGRFAQRFYGAAGGGCEISSKRFQQLPGIPRQRLIIGLLRPAPVVQVAARISRMLHVAPHQVSQDNAATRASHSRSASRAFPKSAIFKVKLGILPNSRPPKISSRRLRPRCVGSSCTSRRSMMRWCGLEAVARWTSFRAARDETRGSTRVGSTRSGGRCQRIRWPTGSSCGPARGRCPPAHVGVHYRPATGLRRLDRFSITGRTNWSLPLKRVLHESADQDLVVASGVRAVLLLAAAVRTRRPGHPIWCGSSRHAVRSLSHAAANALQTRRCSCAQTWSNDLFGAAYFCWKHLQTPPVT